MTLHVYEWFSYSCNNSSDHRLVAEFESHETARAMVDELRALFLAHAEQVDAAIDAGEDWPYDAEASPALKAIAEKYGSEMREGMTWGDGDAYVDDLPEVAQVGGTVYVYHGYMGGFGDLSGVLDRAGAVRTDFDAGAACLQFAATARPGEEAAMQGALDRFFAQRETTDSLSRFDCPWGGRLPISKALEKLVIVHGKDRSTFTLMMGAKAVSGVLGWLESIGAAAVEVKLVTDAELGELRKREPAKKRPEYTAVVVHREPVAAGSAPGWTNMVTCIVVDGERMVLCGGGGKNLLRRSTDGGKTFETVDVGVGTGLRCYLEDDHTTFVCGQLGLLARSVDGGPFEAVTTGATKCAQTVLRADGALWLTGDSGVFRSADDGKSWTKVDAIAGEVARARDSALGLLLPTSEGMLVIGKGGKLHTTSLRAGGAPVWAACATPKGTLLAVGKTGVWRSTDGGATFSKVAVAKGSLENIACTDSGRVVVCGEHGALLYSCDDGATFQRVEQPHTQSWLFAATAVGERILVGGVDGWVLEIVLTSSLPSSPTE